jgi:hypothetical protein
MSNTESSKARNKYVVQLESGHPGFRNYLFIASEQGLRELSGALLRLSDLPTGARIDFHVTERGNPDSLGALAFAKCSEQKLVELQQPTAKSRARDLSRSLLWVGAIAVFSVGAWHSAKYVLQLVVSIVGGI